MSVDLAVLALAGLAAGAVNAAAGGGSLISFPALLALGHSPLVANVTNTVGLLPGYAGGVVAYRKQLRDQRGAVRTLGASVAAGALIGCALLLAAPERVFARAAPLLLVAACLLLAAQPRLTRALRARDGGSVRRRPLLLHAAVGLAGAYAAYFGAAVGVLLLAVLGVLVPDRLQRLNALKSALSLLAIALGAAVFLALAPVHLRDAGVLAVASLAGGVAGGGLARRLPDDALRLGVVAIGLAAAAYLLL